MTPPFFAIHPEGDVAGTLRQIRRIGQLPCPRCSRLEEQFYGPVEVEVGKVRHWPDLLPTAYAALFSERVKDGLESSKVDFESEPVQLRMVDSTNCAKPPAYYLLRVPTGLDLDIAASQCSGLHVCDACGSILAGGLDCSRFAYDMESWNRQPWFTLRKPRMPQFFCCTFDVLELARADRWTNFRFDPLDVPRDLLRRSGYKGIDYLGSPWPPRVWYPERPSKGRTPQEWLDIYNTARDDSWYEAWQALLDLGSEVLPLAVKQFRSPHAPRRTQAARLLVALKRAEGLDVPADILDDAVKLWPDPSITPTE